MRKTNPYNWLNDDCVYDPVTESFHIVMEAPQDDEEEPEEDDATDYNAEDDTDEELDDEQNNDEEDVTGAEVQDEDGEDTEEEEPADTETDDTDLGDDEATDYNADDDMGTDDTDSAEDTDTETEDTTGTEDSSEEDDTALGNITIKNFNLLKDFSKLFSLLTELVEKMEKNVYSEKAQVSIMMQITANTRKLRDFCLAYIQDHFNSEDYKLNLYYYNIIIQCLKMNLNMLEKLKEFDDNFKQTK